MVTPTRFEIWVLRLAWPVTFWPLAGLIIWGTGSALDSITNPWVRAGSAVAVGLLLGSAAGLTANMVKIEAGHWAWHRLVERMIEQGLAVRRDIQALTDEAARLMREARDERADD
jgi:hypothetical protein